MNRWKRQLLLLGLGLGGMGGVLGFGLGRTHADQAYTMKELKKLWKKEENEAKRSPPKPEPSRSERERRAENALQTVKDMCATLRQSPLSLAR